MTDKPTVIFAANRGYALTSSREELIRRFIYNGWQAVLVTADDAESRLLKELGAYLEPVRFDRGGFSPATDLSAFKDLRRIYRKWRPRLIQHFHAKPVIFGSIISKQIPGNSTRVVNTITGLGHAFVTGGVTSHLAGTGYRLASGRADRTVFQNRDDQALFLDKGWLTEEKARLVPGSGVDTARFGYVERRNRGQEAPVVVMLGRLLNQKGISEFVELSQRIRKSWPKSRFLWAGEEDPVHPDAVSADWLQAQEGVEYLGLLSDVTPLLAQADLLLFPSYYREGVPRVVLEAAATGLPTVGFDVPGVREAVRDSETGFLVQERDVDALTRKVAELIQNKEKRLAMGQAARRVAEEGFDIQIIQKQYLDIYRALGIEI